VSLAFVPSLTLAAASWLAAPAAAPAAPPDSPPISLRGEHAPLALRRQLRAELRTLGLVVVESTPADEGSPRDPPPPRSIELDADARTAWIRVWSPREHVMLERRLTLPAIHDDSDVRVVSLQIVEVLQTLVTEAERSPAPASAPAPEPPATTPTTPVPAPPQRLGMWAAGGAQWSPGGMSPGFSVDAGLAWDVRPWLAPALLASLPVIAPQHRSDEGQVRAWPSTLAVGARVRPGPPAARVHFEVTTAVGASWLAMRGDARAPYQGRSAQAFGVVVQARPGVAIGLGRRLRLRVDGLVGGRWPQVVVGVAQRSPAALDPLVVGGSLGLELRLRAGSKARPAR